MSATDVASLQARAQTFAELHAGAEGFIIPNPWDVGSARVLVQLGFSALATTSAGFANTLGNRDGNVTRDQVLEHARQLCAAVAVPVTADLENGFSHTPDDVATTITLAGATGLVGGSIEDWSGESLYEADVAVARIAAAVSAAQALPFDFVLTARAENFLRGNRDLDDTIARLQAFEAAGADVLYAPGLPSLEAVSKIAAAVSKPINVLAVGPLAQHSAAELVAAGASRISVGSLLSLNALAALEAAGTQLLDGSFGFAQQMPSAAVMGSMR